MLIPLAALAFLLFSSIRVVDAGGIAIVSRLGNLAQLNPGLHSVAPPISCIDYVYTKKTTILEQSNFAPTKEGLTVQLDTAISFRLNPDSAVSLYGSVGKGYNAGTNSSLPRLEFSGSRPDFGVRGHSSLPLGPFRDMYRINTRAR